MGGARTFCGSGIVIRGSGRPCLVVSATRGHVCGPKRPVNALCDALHCRIQKVAALFTKKKPVDLDRDVRLKDGVSSW
jgi:hypothetical protein